MLIRVLTAVILFCLVAIVSSYAANTVLVESKSVPVSANNVTVGIYVENDDELGGLVIPLEIRSVTTGSFIADTLYVQATNRLTTQLIGYTVKSYLPAEDNTRYWICGGEGEGFHTRGLPNFASPDALLYAAVVGAEDSCLSIGDDGAPPGGTPSLRITFGVSSTIGTFEIDTTCITPANHLVFMTYDVPAAAVVPLFTKSVIEIGCECQCHADPQCDGYHDIVDWVKIKNVAQGSSGPIPDSSVFCPVVTTDVNCDGVTNNTDKNLMYEVVFNGADPDTLFCDPCP